MQNPERMDRTNQTSLPNHWELNAIVLHHSQRFFDAVNQVIERWSDPDEARLGSLIALVGNVLWAQSPYITRGPAEEETFALAGALAATVGEKMGGVEVEARLLAREIVSRNERRLRARHDDIVEQLLTELRTEQPPDPTPGTINRWVWDRMFPGFSFDLGQSQLRDEVLCYLEGPSDG